jgi:uncharacterized protein YcsI (UPF0317 family)
MAIAANVAPSERVTYEDLCTMTAAEARGHFRNGAYSGHTAGIAPGMLQGNVVILPADLALDFSRFCQRNPQPCPLIGVTDTGDPMMRTLGDDIDIRTDVPAYRIYEYGELKDEVTDISDLWQDDFVAFAIGCSFSFEDALIQDGIRLRHLEQNKTVSMFVTNLMTEPAGPFSGGTVVSMRPLPIQDAIRASAICARFPQAHGQPVHMGDPAEIGITDINAPDWGDPTEFRDGEIPVFWACGVTPQNIVRSAKPPFCITHAPGRMLVTDVPAWATDSKKLKS